MQEGRHYFHTLLFSVSKFFLLKTSVALHSLNDAALSLFSPYISNTLEHEC